MKKYVCLLLVSFMAFAVSSCSSDEEKEPAVGNIQHTPVLNDKDVLHHVQIGDVVEINTLRDAKIWRVYTYAYVVGESIDESQDMRNVAGEDPFPEEFSFHWLNVKQEKSNKFVLSISNNDDEYVPQVIIIEFQPHSSYDSNRKLQLKLVE